jgi:hypothetical protein
MFFVVVVVTYKFRIVIRIIHIYIYEDDNNEKVTKKIKIEYHIYS